MAVIKCKMCGGDLVIEPGATVAECEYCGTKQTIPNQDDEKKLTLLPVPTGCVWAVSLIKRRGFTSPSSPISPRRRRPTGV